MLSQHHKCVCRVTIKGNTDQEAVLCTDQATYAMKHVETTNTLFMVSGCEKSHDDRRGTMCVKATSAAHLELTQTAPQLKELDAVLNVGIMGPDTVPVCQSAHFVCSTCGTGQAAGAPMSVLSAGHTAAR